MCCGISFSTLTGLIVSATQALVFSNWTTTTREMFQYPDGSYRLCYTRMKWPPKTATIFLVSVP